MTRRQRKREAMRELIYVRRCSRRMPHPERVRRLYRAQVLHTLRLMASELSMEGLIDELMPLTRLLFPEGLPMVARAAVPIVAPLRATYRDEG